MSRWPVVARVVATTTAEGPFSRTAIWAAGCSIRCSGCFNQHLFDGESGVETDPAAIVDVALAAGVEGLTLLGGEPFDQAAQLASVAALAQSHDLGVMTFTGYTLGNLVSRAARGEAGVEALLASTDLLVDGPFVNGRLDTRRPWVGSTNQSFRFLTERYLDVAKSLEEHPDRLEIRVTAEGVVEINGWSPGASIQTLLAALPTHARD